MGKEKKFRDINLVVGGMVIGETIMEVSFTYPHINTTSIIVSIMALIAISYWWNK